MSLQLQKGLCQDSAIVHENHSSIDFGICSVNGIYVGTKFFLSGKYFLEPSVGYYIIPLTRREYRMALGLFSFQKKGMNSQINFGLTARSGFYPNYNIHSFFVSPNGSIQVAIIYPVMFRFRLGVSFESNETEKKIFAIPNIGLSFGLNFD